MTYPSVFLAERYSTTKPMSNRTTDGQELDVYRKLSEFSQKAWKSYWSSLYYSEQLLNAVQALLTDGYQPSDDFVGNIVMNINMVLYQDCNNSRSSQRRRFEPYSRGNLRQFDRSLHVLYSILRTLNFEKIHSDIDGSLFCRHPNQIFIFPGYPDERQRNRGWEYSHGKFLLEQKKSALYIPFDHVQHVVHNIEDLLRILNLNDSKTKADAGLKVCLKGRTNLTYNGPDLIWFSPVLPASPTNPPMCPSLDPTSSRYGCFRLTVPFAVIERQYLNAYCLGTRKYNQQYCHSYLLTSAGKDVTFIEKLKPIQLTSSEFVLAGNDSNDRHWLCSRAKENIAWDVVDFAVATSELNLSVRNDRIRLDFVNHSRPCVPTLRTHLCNSPQTKTDAMRCFLKELKKTGIRLAKLRDIFESNMFNDLDELNSAITSAS